jgi:hypothetical protein
MTRKDEQQADDQMMAALSVIAHRTAEAPKPKRRKVKASPLKKKLPQMPQPDLTGTLKAKPPKKPRIVLKQARPQWNSEFFFQVSESFDADLARRRKAMTMAKSPELEALDADVENRRKTYQEQLPAELQANIERIREFFLKDIAPLLMAASAGVTQAQQVIHRTVDSPVDERPFAQFEAMLKSAASVRMAEFVTEYMGLSKDLADTLLNAVLPKREMMIFHPDMLDEQSRRQRDHKNPEKQKAAP